MLSPASSSPSSDVTLTEPAPRPKPAPAYRTPAGRDLRYDLLRGFFVFAMIVDHILGPSWVHLLTGGNRFFASAAEGFIFISGLLAGQVYGGLIERDGLGRALQRLLIRAGHLYVLAIALTLVFIPFSEMLDLPWAQGVDRSNTINFILSVLTLHRTYYLVDVPQIYALLLLVSPLAFILLSEGRTWVVLGASWLLWGLYQFAPQYADLPWPIAGNYVFNFSAWQVLFFTGIVIGYREAAIRRIFARVPAKVYLVLTTLGTAAIIIAFALFDRFTSGLVGLDDASLTTGQMRTLTLANALFAKGDLRIGRIVAFAIVFAFLFVLTTECWRPVRRVVGWLLLPLGREALYSYTLHVILAAVVALSLRPLALPYPGSPRFNTVVQLASVAVIWVLVRYRVLLPNRDTRRWFLLSPIACLVLVIVAFPWDPSPSHPGLDPAPTPAADIVRKVRSFGTPTPKLPPPGVAPVPLPKPPPPKNAEPVAAAEPRPVSEFVGSLRGSLREFAFYSGSLDTDRSYFIYLPPDYGTAGRRYPVLYMLHGASGDKEEWPALGLIDAADQMITSGEILPLIIVLPAGDFGYWANNVDNGPRWADYVANDLVQHIDSAYRSLPRARSRAIGGLSFGGHGALAIAFHHPDLFGVVGAHSPSLHADDGTLSNIIGTAAEFAERDPVQLAATAPNLEQLQIWIDIGDEDNFRDRAAEMSVLLAQRGIEHQFLVFPGEHSSEYWAAKVDDYLRFYSQALNRQ